MKIAVLDDNPRDVEIIGRMLKKAAGNEEIRVFEYLNAPPFLEEMKTEKFDAVFIDIVLDKKDGIDGIEIGRIINSTLPEASVVFVSAHEGYFRDVYKVKHVYFLTKEPEEARFADAVAKIIDSVHSSLVSIPQKNGNVNLNVKDIVYAESEMKKVYFHMKDNSVVECRGSIRKIQAYLPRDLFLRIHQSFVVNMSCIERYRRQSVTVLGTKELPISRAYINTARERMSFYLGGTL